MVELIGFSKPGGNAALRERRRPGRAESADPQLIPLLRQQPPPTPDEAAGAVELGEASVDRGRAAAISATRGIGLGVVLGTLIWACVGIGLWLYFAV